jgi:transcriptional regulator with XRE-family HTH domain
MTTTPGTEVRNRTSKPRKLSRPDQRELQRGLATRELTRSQLARKFGVSTSYVSQFARKYAAEVAAIQRDLDNEFAGLWIAQKELRLTAYQQEYELAMKHPRRDHFEWVRVRSQILRMVADELGQLPPKATITVIPVTHVIVGLESKDLELLQ